MLEHLFLCGLTNAQCTPYNNATRLHLHGPLKSVNLKLNKLRDRLIRLEPEALTDLLEIAAYVFRADNAVSRGSERDPQLGDKWRRTFRLVVAVREPGLWSKPAVMGALKDTLHFLSDDDWHFDFVEIVDPPRLQAYLPGMRPSDPDLAGDTTVLLFSGGLDSFAGAVQEIQTQNRMVVLASHRTTPFIGKHQERLAKVLIKSYPGRVVHVPVDAGTSGKDGGREHSQRTRSFLFMAVAAAVAVIEGADRIRFYENGIMSVNLPISEQVVGTHASRSTHPRSLLLLNKLMTEVIPTEIVIDNPFILETKAEVVQRLKLSSFGQYIKNTLSCSASREMTKMHPHCGTCKQCIERRISTLGAGAMSVDSADAYKVDLITGPRQIGKDRSMAVDTIRTALDLASISELDFAKRFAGELPWLLSAYPLEEAGQRAADFHGLFRKQGTVVKDILTNAVADNRTGFIDGTLARDSLLWLVVDQQGSSLLATGAGPPRSAIEPSNSSPMSAQAEVSPTGANFEAELVLDEVVLFFDEAQTRFQVSDLIPFTGRTTARLLSFLVNEYRKDRNADRPKDAFRAFRAKELADAIGAPSDEAIRKLVSRIREELRSGFAVNAIADPGQDALIESVKGGFRLNPNVRLVAKTVPSASK